MGILISDSGNESILKFDFERKGLSGINLLEQDDASNAVRNIEMNNGFQELNIL